MELSRVQSNSMQEDFLEIRGLFSKFLEKCDEFIESNREKCDEFIESNREVYLELGIKEIHLEEPEFANGETKDELQLGSEKATQEEPIDSVENGEYSRAQFSGKLLIHLKFLTVGRVVHDFWVHNGSPKMASNARATGFIALFMKGDVLSSIFWLLVDTIWDPGGNYLNLAPNATSKVANPTKNVLGKMNEPSSFSEILLKREIFFFGSSSSFHFLSILLIQNYRQTIRVLFLVEDWQFQFGLLISSPVFLKFFYISAYKVFGESTDPYLAIQIATVTACAEFGVAACVFSYSYHDEVSIGFEVDVHNLLECEPREVPRIVLHVSLASNIPILVRYNPSGSDYLTTLNQLLVSQNVLPRFSIALDKIQSSIEYFTSHHCWLRAVFDLLIIRKPNYGLCPRYFLVQALITITPMFGRCRLVAAMKDQNMKWVDKEGKTPLIVACMAPERFILAKTLIELVAKVNTYRPGLHAGTPLHHAAKRGLNHTVRLLLSHGANPLVRNDDGQTPLNVARSRGFVNVVRAIESHICFFSGWLREFYGSGFLEAFALQLLSRKIRAVSIPCSSHNPLKPLKLELAIYSSLQEAQPHTVVALWKADIEEPKVQQSDGTLTIFDKSIRSCSSITETRYKFASARGCDKQQIQSLYDACRGTPQVMPPQVRHDSETSAPLTDSQTAAEAAELAMAINVSLQSAMEDRLLFHPTDHPTSEANNVDGWGVPESTSTKNPIHVTDMPTREEHNGWGV